MPTTASPRQRILRCNQHIISFEINYSVSVYFRMPVWVLWCHLLNPCLVSFLGNPKSWKEIFVKSLKSGNPRKSGMVPGNRENPWNLPLLPVPWPIFRHSSSLDSTGTPTPELAFRKTRIRRVGAFFMNLKSGRVWIIIGILADASADLDSETSFMWTFWFVE